MATKNGRENEIWIDGIPWTKYGRILKPVSMPHIAINPDRAKLREEISKNNLLLACWSSEWDALKSSEWWWTIYDGEDEGVESLTSGDGKRSVKRGLRHCDVRSIPAGDFADLAYPIFRRELESYGEQPPSHSAYASNIERVATSPDMEFWGAFHDGDLAAFAMCKSADNAVTFISAKSNPLLNRFNPNAALYYHISRHYVRQGRDYFSNGWRTLAHPTEINTFLLKLGFRRAYCKLNVELSPIARIINGSNIAKFGNLIGPKVVGAKTWRQVRGFDKLMRIAKTFR